VSTIQGSVKQIQCRFFEEAGLTQKDAKDRIIAPHEKLTIELPLAAALCHSNKFN